MTPEDGFDRDLLRRDPAAFFGLEEEFDAKDLRRAYHAAIRRFRPETHPVEFQLIREAHDRLALWAGTGGLRRGPAPAPEPAGPPPAPRPLDSPSRRAEAYRELSRDPRAAGDFVALALLADSVPSADRGFEAWILEGLARHPSDDGLEALLRLYQQEDLPDAEVPRFLRRASSVLPPRLPWTLAAYSWETAALRCPFEEFRALWEQCRSPEDDIHEGTSAALLAYLLPLLAPSADREWLAETVAWLGERHDLLHDRGAVLDAVEAWIPLRKAVDAGMRPAARPVMETELRAGRRVPKPPIIPARFPRGPVGEAVLELAHALLASGCRDGGDRLSRAASSVGKREEGVLAAFRPPDAPLTKVLGGFARWAGQMASRQPSFDPAREPKDEIRLVYAVHRKADEALRGTKEGLLLSASKKLGIAFLDHMTTLFAGILLFVLFILGASWLAMGVSGEGRGAGLVGTGGGLALLGSLAGAIYLYGHQPRFWTRLNQRIADSILRRAYSRRVRPVLVEAVRDFGLPAEALVDPELVARGDLNPLVAWGVAEDPALPILRLAHRFAP